MKAHIIRFIGFCLLLGTAGLQSCDLFKADDPKPLTELEKLPPITQAGKNTFGCLVNGKAWVAPTQNDALASYQLGVMFISGSVPIPLFQDIDIVLHDDPSPIETKTYSLVQYPISYCSSYFVSSKTCDYLPENTISGFIMITKIDRINFIVSGTFEFVTELPNCEQLTVTHGRFDINYVP
jgi:hypothetical protein